MLDIKLVTTSSGDWQGLYIDGELVCDNHRITAGDILDFLQDNLLIVANPHIEVSDSHLESFGYQFPNYFETLEKTLGVE